MSAEPHHALVEVISPDLATADRAQINMQQVKQGGAAGAASRRKLLANNFLFKQHHSSTQHDELPGNLNMREARKVNAHQHQQHMMNNSFEEEGAKKLLTSKRSIVGGTAN